MLQIYALGKVDVFWVTFHPARGAAFSCMEQRGEAGLVCDTSRSTRLHCFTAIPIAEPGLHSGPLLHSFVIDAGIREPSTLVFYLRVRKNLYFINVIYCRLNSFATCWAFFLHAWRCFICTCETRVFSAVVSWNGCTYPHTAVWNWEKIFSLPSMATTLK